MHVRCLFLLFLFLRFFVWQVVRSKERNHVLLLGKFPLLMELLLLLNDFSFRLCKIDQQVVDLFVKALTSLDFDCLGQVFKLFLAEISDVFFFGNLFVRAGGEARHELYYFFIRLWLIAQLLPHLL